MVADWRPGFIGVHRAAPLNAGWRFCAWQLHSGTSYIVLTFEFRCLAYLHVTNKIETKR